MTGRNPRRYRAAAGTPRRQPRIRRASGGLTPIRSAALLTMLAASGALFGLATTSAFGFARLEIQGSSLTSDAAIRAAAAIEPGTNLVGLTTEPIVARIRDLLPVRDAAVAIGLPDVVQVTIRERRPIVVWQIGERRFAVDDTGLLFADVTTDPTGTTASIPVVRDERAVSVGLVAGGVLDAVVLDAATRIGSLTPGQIGSLAPRLEVRITDERGFTVSSGPNGWVAVFGSYLGSQRTPALIPGQVQLLASFLQGRETKVATVI